MGPSDWQCSQRETAPTAGTDLSRQHLLLAERNTKQGPEIWIQQYIDVSPLGALVLRDLRMRGEQMERKSTSTFTKRPYRPYFEIPFLMTMTNT